MEIAHAIDKATAVALTTIALPFAIIASALAIAAIVIYAYIKIIAELWME